MDVIKLHTHMIAANTYIVFDEETKDAVVIDPSFFPEKIEACIREEGFSVRAVLLTHGHFDHIAGLQELREDLGVEVYIHEADAGMLTSAEKNQSTYYRMETAYDPAEHLVKDGDALSFDSMTFQVISTPGHTPGSVCYQIADMLFTGDTLFFLSIGRTDFPGGNYDDMMQSLAKLAQIEENLKVYPGHEQSSSLDYEKDNNPFMP